MLVHTVQRIGVGVVDWAVVRLAVPGRDSSKWGCRRRANTDGKTTARLGMLDGMVVGVGLCAVWGSEECVCGGLGGLCA